jgi:hypothetical protein
MPKPVHATIQWKFLEKSRQKIRLLLITYQKTTLHVVLQDFTPV